MHSSWGRFLQRMQYQKKGLFRSSPEIDSAPLFNIEGH